MCPLFSGVKPQVLYKALAENLATADAYAYKSIKVEGYPNILVLIRNVHASNKLTFIIQGSLDKSFWQQINPEKSLSAGSSFIRPIPNAWRWIRIGYKNTTAGSNSKVSIYVAANVRGPTSGVELWAGPPEGNIRHAVVSDYAWDGFGNATNNLLVMAWLMGFNGTSWADGEITHDLRFGQAPQKRQLALAQTKQIIMLEE